MPIRTDPFTFQRQIDVIVDAPEEGSANLGTILALHGMGESARDFQRRLRLAPGSERWTWIVPEGPFPFERRRSGHIGHAWYLFGRESSDAQRLLMRSMLESAEYLNAVVDALTTARGVSSATAVLGFSQGGYLASVLGGRFQERYHAVCCVGGRLKHEFFEPKGAALPRFLQLHGEVDEAVPVTLARDAVDATRRLGFDVEMETFGGVGHELTPEITGRFLQWLETRCGD